MAAEGRVERLEQIILVCALADAAFIVECSIYDRRCSKCASEVMIAPSGQRVLKLHPDCVIVCLPCAMQSGIGFFVMPPTDEQRQEMKTAIVNPRKKPNHEN